MSRIDTLRQDYRPKYQPNVMPNVKHMPSKVAKNPSFTGGLSPEDENLVYKILLSQFKSLKKLSDTIGEVQNILFIGLGTAFVAPLFIAYNPLSKQDGETKKYSALRQPISAVIATAMGLGINIPVAKAFNKMAAEGSLERFNMQAKPPVDFLKDRYKGIIKHFGKMREKDKKYFDLINDGTVNDIKSFTKKYPTFQEFVNGVHAVTKKQAAEKLLDPKNLNGIKNITLKDFMVNTLKVKEHPFEKGQLNPDYVKKYMSKTSAVGFLRKIGIKTDEGTLRTFLGKNFYKDRFDAEILNNKNLAIDLFEIIKKNSKKGDFEGMDEEKLRNLFKDGLSRKGFDEQERKTISRLSELWVNEKAKSEEKIPVKTLFKVLGIEDDFHKHPHLNSKMDDFLLWMDKNLTEGVQPEAKKTITKIEKQSVENVKKLKDFAGQIAVNAVQKAESDFKAYSKWQGIVLSLLVLPFSCGILNWSYPRIMDKFFPKLADSKNEPKPAPKVERKLDVLVDNKGGK